MPINSFLYPAPSNSNPFEVSNSLRFNDDSSDYLSRSYSSAGNRRTWTFSCWAKIGTPAHHSTYFGANNAFQLEFHSSGAMIAWKTGGDFMKTTALFRDVSAWYHIVWAFDTTQSTAANRVKLYINGTEITSWATASYPSENEELEINNAVAHYVGDYHTGTSENMDGYLAEVCLVDGQQLDATSFGEFDSASPTIWKPKEILTKLDFGTNGFYLQFKNSSSLGTDSSTGGNNFTVNNLTSIDQTTDTCTNNFAILNPLDFTGSVTATEGNTVFQGGRYKATFGVSSGKWYWEAKRLNAPDNAYVGIKADDSDWNNSFGNSYTVYTYTGNYYLNGSDQGSYGSSSTTNDILIFALDMDNGKFYIGENGTFYNSGDPAAGSNPMASSISGTYLPTAINNSPSGTDQYSFNFGNPSFSISSGNADANGHGNFEYSVPSGYFALCSKNLAEFG
jgi:hypothetical protein